LDGRKSSEKPPDFYELAAALYNDKQFNPYTFNYPSLHKDFEYHIILFGREAPLVTAQKLKEKLTDVRGKLVIIVKNYEQSGNGAGSCLDNDPDYGPVANMTLTDNSDRQNFLGGNKPHLLYLLEEFELLDNTLQVIPNEISATCESVPETVYSTPANKKSKINDEYMESQKSFQSNVGASFAELARNSTLLAITALRKEYLDLHQQYVVETNPETKEILRVVEEAKATYEKASGN
jgi:hypothetical protein